MRHLHRHQTGHANAQRLCAPEFNSRSENIERV
jgi:hypothetical protein